MADATDFLAMSDEDFLKQSSVAPSAVEDTPVVESPKAETTPQEAPAVEAEAPAAQTGVADPHQDAVEAPKAEAEVSADTPAQTATETAPKTEGDQPKAETAPASKESAASGEKAVETQAQDPANYEAFYKRVMTPFKANGRTVELKTPEEAIQLMQMGANFTRKMQELAPHRKMLTMLQNNGLLDEGKLSYLIDIEKKNPEAIKKLIKDAGIDPMDIDTSVEPAYREGNHRVSDEEVNFRTILDDMWSNPEEAETIKVINGDWDQASKEALFKNPGIMRIMHEQRANGIYDRVVTEINRQQTLGKIPASVSFLQAYKTVGDDMANANAFADLAPKPAVVATRVAAPKAPAADGDRVAAVSPNRHSPGAAKGVQINPLAMSDDEFLKQFAGRL